MPTLIACLSSGKGTWTEVNRIINAKKWDKIFLITNKFGKDNFKKPDQAQFILIDNFNNLNFLITNIKNQLNNKILDFEIALNFCSGTGKEHMALLEAVLELGLNFRLVTLNESQQLEILGLN